MATIVGKYDLKITGKRIQRERVAYKLYETGKTTTLEELSEMINVSRHTLSKWERGETQPTLSDLYNLCNLFGCDVGYLLGEYDCKTRIAADIQAETGLSEKAIERIRVHKKIAHRDTTGLHIDIEEPPKIDIIDAVNALLEFNDGDILELVSQYLKYEPPQENDISVGNVSVNGKIFADIFLFEIGNELKAIREKRIKEKAGGL